MSSALYRVKGRWDPPSTEATRIYRLTFGKYRGFTLAECPEDYLVWLCDEAESPALRLLARRQLGIDVIIDEGEEHHTESAAVLFPLLCYRWEQTLIALYGDDPATIEGDVVCQGRAVLRGLCAEVTGQCFPDGEEHQW